MQVSKLVVISFLSATLFSRAESANSVDVLVAAAPDVDADVYVVATELSTHMTVIHSNSLMLDKVYRFRPYILPTTYPYGTTGTGAQALAFVTNETDPSLNSARETANLSVSLGVPAYDLVILVVKVLKDDYDPTKYLCGYASLFYGGNLSLDPMDSSNPSTRYGLVLSDSPACRLNRRKTIAHELGHVFGGDHQLPGVGDTHLTDDDSPYFPTEKVGALQVPASNNHPMIHRFPDGTKEYTTVMSGSASFPWVPQYSDPANVLVTNSSKVAGDSTANMKRIIEKTWENVAAYRPLQTEDCTLIFGRMCGLPAHITQAFITATPMLTGHTILNMDIDYRIGVSGPWNDMYNGPQSCPAIGLDLNSTVSFQALVNTTVGVSICSAVVSPILLAPGYCEPPGGGGGGTF